MILRSAVRGEWGGIESDWRPPEVEEFRKGRGKLNYFGRGLADAIDANYLDFEENEGVVYYVPKEGLMQYIQSKVIP